MTSTPTPSDPVAAVREATKIEPGSEMHLTVLGVPMGWNFLVGKDRADMLAFGRAVWASALKHAETSAAPAAGPEGKEVSHGTDPRSSGTALQEPVTPEGRASVINAPDAAALLAQLEAAQQQHHRDSAELRSLCEARDAARRERDLCRVEIAGLTASVGNLCRLVDELRPGHDRYQWLRDRPLETVAQGGVFAGKTPDNVVINGADLDAAIDAVLAEQQEGSHGNV